jgi:hypothetical protein
MKMCHKCNTMKPCNEFHKNVRSGDGLQTQCAECGREYSINYNLRNERQAWRHMLNRCNDPKHHAFDRYGGRGIKVCDRWSDYDNFLADMGQRPYRKAELDRIDNNSGYRKDNCRWTNHTTNMRNRRNVTMTMETARLIRAAKKRGKRTQRAIAKAFGISPQQCSVIIQGKIWKEGADMTTTEGETVQQTQVIDFQASKDLQRERLLDEIYLDKFSDITEGETKAYRKRVTV